MGNSQPILTIIHFNDVYDIQQMKKGGKGAINFEAAIRKMRQTYPKSLLLFSGDAFSPSVLTNIFEGEQMVWVLNKLGVDLACMGNHEFDLEPAKTLELFGKCDFPWLLGNIKVKSTGKILGNGIPYSIKIQDSKKIGFFGVAGEDWIQILSDQYEDALEYQDVYEYSTTICKLLREEQECDIVIALTHMRNHQDRQLAQKVPEIDLILGGHDHVKMSECINNTPVVKSGDNFKSFSLINVYEKGANQKCQFKGSKFDFQIDLHKVEDAEEGEKNEEIVEYVGKCWQEYQKYDRVLGFSDTILNTSGNEVRSQETNYGNFLADLVKLYFNADCSILNSGCLRADCKLQPGEIKYSFVSNIINDLIIVKKVTGQVLLKALERSVSGLPESFGGNFLLVSGFRYEFDHRDSSKVKAVTIKEKKLQKNKQYAVAMNHYIAWGGDGFDMLKTCPNIVDEAKGVELLVLLLNFFKLPDLLKKEKSKKNIQQKQEACKIERINKLASRMLTIDQEAQNRGNGKRYVCIAPQLDARIRNLAIQTNDTQGAFGDLTNQMNLLPNAKKEDIQEIKTHLLKPNTSIGAYRQQIFADS